MPNNSTEELALFREIAAALGGSEPTQDENGRWGFVYTPSAEALASMEKIGTRSKENAFTELLKKIRAESARQSEDHP